MNSYPCDQGNHQICHGLIPPAGRRKKATKCGCPCHRKDAPVKAPHPEADKAT